MSSRLDRIRDWEKLAAECDYCAKKLAVRCRVSRQHLRRYFEEQFHVAPKTWLDDLRVRAAKARLKNGDAVKEVSADCHFRQPAAFTRFFKRLARTTPANFQRNVPEC